MEQTVTFRERQNLSAGDFNAMQAIAQGSIDALIAAAVTDRPVYHGFQVTKTEAASVRVAPGRYFASNGAVYVRETETLRDFISTASLPANALRKVAVITYGQLEDTHIERRSMRIDATSNTIEQDNVTMRQARVAQLSFLFGAESADPQLPAIDANYLHVATITLSTAGVASVEMVGANAADNLAGVAAAVKAHESLLAVFQTMFVTLRTDMAALAFKQRLAASSTDLQAILFDLARLKARAGIASNALAYGDNLFLDWSGSDKTYAGFDAKILAGLRFPEATASETALALFNLNDPAVKVENGFCVPAYDVEPRITIDGYSGDMSLANYQSQNVTSVLKTRSRERVVYGETSEILINLNDPNYDRINGLYSRNGEVLQVTAEWFSGGSNQAMIVLTSGGGTITEEEPYWEAVSSTVTVQGSTLAQSFINAQGGYTVGVDAYFTDIAATGDVHAHLVECDASGAPDMSRTIGKVTKARNDLVKYPAATRFGLPPTAMEPGKRYAWAFVSLGAHRLAVADKNRYAAGQLFTSADSAFFSAAPDKDMLLSIQSCRFRASRVTVQLQPLQLAGGMSDIDMLYENVRVAGTDLIFEIQPQGSGQWFTINGPDAVSALSTLPAAVNARLTFNGSQDMMPGLKLSDSVVRCFRRKTAFKHVTPDLTRVTTSTIKVTAFLRGFSAAAPASHTCLAKILIGGVTELYDLVADEVVPAIGGDPGGIKRTWTFNIAAPTSSYRIELSGTAADARNPFVITECVDQAL